ncbi:MAG: rod-binding protein [Clostridiales bacterium]|nr:rod-binding protein [Clostridiales bacterium]
MYKEQASGEGFQAALEAASHTNDAVELRKACVGFESYFLQIMFREMRKTDLGEGGIFAKSNAEVIFEDMLYEEYSKTAASRGGIGLADMMYRQLSEQ